MAETIDGTIRFHEWIGDAGGVVLAPHGLHPDMHHRARLCGELSPEFQRRNVKLIGLSVDSVEDHYAWLDDIEETQGTRPDYPIIADTDLNVSKLYGMLEADAEDDAASRCAGRTAATASAGRTAVCAMTFAVVARLSCDTP